MRQRDAINRVAQPRSRTAAAVTFFAGLSLVPGQPGSDDSATGFFDVGRFDVAQFAAGAEPAAWAPSARWDVAYFDSARFA